MLKMYYIKYQKSCFVLGRDGYCCYIVFWNYSNRILKLSFKTCNQIVTDCRIEEQDYKNWTPAITKLSQKLNISVYYKYCQFSFELPYKFQEK